MGCSAINSISRRSFALGSATTMGVFSTRAFGAVETPYPTRSVRLLQGFTPGGPMDLLARVISGGLNELWGQPFVVEAKPGAGGIIAASQIARAAPDGYTLALFPSNHVQTPAVVKNLPYDPLKDFTPIRQIAKYPFILVVHPSLPIRSMKEFVDRAKAEPRSISFAIPGVGSAPHLGAAQLARIAGIEFKYVPYGGVSPTQLAVVSGEVNATFLSAPLAVAEVHESRLRGLAATGKTRWRDLPEIATIAEQGFPKFELISWFGIMGPANMPADIVAKLDGGIKKVMQIPETRKRITSAGFDVLDVGPNEFKAVIEADLLLWKKVAADARIQAE